MHLCVLLAFLPTYLTGCGAQYQGLLHKLRISKSLTGNNPGCCATDIRTIQILPDTFCQHLNLFLTKAGIRTNVAGISAFYKRCNTGGKLLGIN